MTIMDFGHKSLVTHTTGLKERIEKAEKEMQMTKQELLAVLDMSEDEQRAEIAKFLLTEPFKHDWGFSNAVGGSNNIAIGEAWICRKCGYEEIYKRIKSGQYIPAVLDKQSPECGLPDPITESLADLAFRLRDEVMSSPKLYTAMLDVHQKAEGANERSQDYVFWSMRANPIHWIIAALIAKEKEDD